MASDVFTSADYDGSANFTIPSNFTTIGDNAFEDVTSLVTITIPASVTTIGTNVFLGAASLTKINVDGSNSYYLSDVNGVLFNKFNNANKSSIKFLHLR